MLKLAYLDLSELSPYTFRGLRDVRMLCIENSDLATVRENAFKGEKFLFCNMEKIKGTGISTFLYFGTTDKAVNQSFNRSQ